VVAAALDRARSRRRGARCRDGVRGVRARRRRRRAAAAQALAGGGSIDGDWVAVPRAPTAVPSAATAPSATRCCSTSGEVDVERQRLDPALAGDRLEAVGSFRIRFADYGFEAPRRPIVTIDPTGTIGFRIRFRRA
jgi:hypothetical protein